MEAISFDVGVIAFPLPGVVEILGEDYPLYINNIDETILKIESFIPRLDREYLNKIHQERSGSFLFEDMVEKIDKNNLYKNKYNFFYKPVRISS